MCTTTCAFIGRIVDPLEARRSPRLASVLDMTDDEATQTKPDQSRRAARRRRELEQHRVHGHGEMARAAQEGEALGGDLLRVLCRRQRRPRPPVTFVFNGGPGASSAYLHVAPSGLSAVDFPADGTLPRMPPRLVQNDESWLAFTDLVFVDPVGTGFSRIIEKDDKKDGDKKRDDDRKKSDEPDPKEYFGYERDTSRWPSSSAAGSRATVTGDRPCFIAGESYGGYRVGRLVRTLQETAGVGPERCDPHLAGARARRRWLRVTATCSAGSTCCRPWPARQRTTASSRAFDRQGRRSKTCSARPRPSRRATTRRS